MRPLTENDSIPCLCLAASGPATSGGLRRLLCTHECTDELVLHFRCDGLCIDACGPQELAGVVDFVNTRCFDVDGFKTSGSELLLILRVGKRAGHTSDPKLHALANFLWNFASNDYVRNSKSPARLEHAEGFPQYAVLVSGKIDHAIRHDYIDTVVRQRDIFNFTLEELDVCETRLALVFFGQSASISSVMSRPYALPVGPTRRAESRTSMPPPDPRSRTISPGFQFRKGCGIATAERGAQSSFGYGTDFAFAVEIGCDRVTSFDGRGGTRAATRSTLS